jgi:hypothetical protein
LKLKPNFLPYLDSQGLVLLRLDRFAEAIAQYDKALAQQSDLPHSLYGRGIAKIRQGAVEAGQADIKAAKDKMPWIAAYFAEMGVKP